MIVGVRLARTRTMNVRVRFPFPLTLCLLPAPAVISAGPVAVRIANSFGV
jgi:hypothetical protein